ncbi:MAG TPA: HAD family hydrolase [Candidatus Binatia bacterium]|nr:HAD family hydrolase [Candidatus Binatia bacterium]
MSRFDAILFDLFDTLVVFERDRLPEVSVNGRVIRSTAGQVHRRLADFMPGIELPAFVNGLLWSWQEAERIRAATHREVSAPERFDMLFRHLGHEPDGLPAGTIGALLAEHMRELSRAVVFPAHHRPLLEALRQRHRLALVSNFDYTPTAHHLLEREGVAHLFDLVVVSADVGWRKPSPVIFEAALGGLGVAAGRALFVGDRADIDVAGARGVGIPVAWINRGAVALAAGEVAPDFEIRDLDELRAIAGIAAHPPRI